MDFTTFAQSDENTTACAIMEAMFDPELQAELAELNNFPERKGDTPHENHEC